MTIKQIKVLKRLSIVYQISIWWAIAIDTYAIKNVHPLFILLVLFFVRNLIREREWYNIIKDSLKFANAMQKEYPDAEIKIDIIKFRRPGN